MVIPHNKLDIDINRINRYTVDFIAHVGDKNARYIDVTFNADGEPIELEQGCTATVTYVSDGVLIEQEAECDVDGSTLVIGIDTGKVENLRSGILEIQPKIVDSSGNIIVSQIPVFVRISPDIAEHGRVEDDSIGTYAEVVREIAAARGKYSNLKDRLDNTAAPTDEQVTEAVSDYFEEHPIALSGIEKYVEVEDTSDKAVDSCTSPDTVYKVKVVSGVVSTARMRVVCSPTVAGGLAQYAMSKDGYIISRKYNGSEWGAWDFIPDSKRVAAMISAAIADKADKTEIPDISGKADKSTTLAGYGITDAYTKTELTIKSAKSYGAKGDGVTNDTKALQAWLTDVATNGGAAYLPKGHYLITEPITIDWSHDGDQRRNFLQKIVGDGCTSYETDYDNSVIIASGIGANHGAIEFISDGNTWGTQVQISDIGIYCDSSCDPMSFCLFYGDSRHLALNRVKMKGYNDLLVRCGSKVKDSSGAVTSSYEHVCCSIEHCDLITRGTKGFSLLPESVLVPNAFSMLDTLSLRDSFIGGVFTVHCNNFSAESCTVTIAGMKDKLITNENVGKLSGFQIDYATGFLIIETASTIIKNTYFEDFKRGIDIVPICGNIRTVLIEGCYFNPGSNQVGNDNKSIKSDYGVLIRAGKTGAKVVYTEISHNVFRHDGDSVAFAVAAIKNEASEKLLCYANAGRPAEGADQIDSRYGEFITENELINPTKTSELVNDSGFITRAECNSIWKTTTAPTAPAAPEQPGYGFAISNLTRSDRDVQIGDMILYSYYYYTVTAIIDSVAYAESRVSIRGSKGAAGDSYNLTAADKTEIANEVIGILPVYSGGVE